MKSIIIRAAALVLATLPSHWVQATETKPTVVLVHGAFADSSSWAGVIADLEKDGYPVVAVANPLRGVNFDGDYVHRIVSSIASPVVLVGHSYGGAVINAAASHTSNVKALVFVAAFAPDIGETVGGLRTKFPGSSIGETLAKPVVQADGGKDLYVQQDKFPQQFAADVPVEKAKLMAATQRPVAEAAFVQRIDNAAWKSVPSWFIYGDADRNIPAQTMSWMAERAKSQGTTVIKGGSHLVMVSNPEKVTEVIEKAASAAVR